MKKRIAALLLLIIMLVSVFVYAEDEKTELPSNVAKIAMDFSEPDADGYFTAKLTLYNATYKGILAYFSYNKEAVVPVDYETKEETSEFDRFAKIPTVAKNLETGEDIPEWCSSKGSKIDIESGLVGLISTISTSKDIPIPNSLITANRQILADEHGLVIYEFHFNKISDETINFNLASTKAIPTGLMLINASGSQAYVVNINVPDKMGESFEVYSSPNVKEKVSNENVSSDEEKERASKIRGNDVIFLSIGNYATVSNNLLKWIDKDNKKVVPLIKDNRTLVPLRFIAEELGAQVSFEEDTQLIHIKTMKTELVLTVGEFEYTNDGVRGEFDVSPEIIEGRTMVPVRFIAEALNQSVSWLEKDQMVIITPKDYPWAEANEIEKYLYERIQTFMSPMLRDFAY